MRGQNSFLTSVVHSLHHVAQSPSFRDRFYPVRLLNPYYVSRHLENYILFVLPSFVEASPAEIGTPSPQGTFSSQSSSAPFAYSELVRWATEEVGLRPGPRRKARRMYDLLLRSAFFSARFRGPY